MGRATALAFAREGAKVVGCDVLVESAEGTDFRPGDPGGMDARMLFRIKAAMARHQWERHQANWRKGKHNAWLEGVYCSGAPAGYTSPVIGTKKDGTDEHGPLQINGHADSIRAAFTLRASGGTFPAVARLLAEKKVPRKGTKWHVASARHIIANTIYKGLFACPCGCGEERRDPELAIVGPAVWAQAQAKKMAEASGYRQRASSATSESMRSMSPGEIFEAKPRPLTVRAKVPWTSSQARTQREQTMHFEGSKLK